MNRYENAGTPVGGDIPLGLGMALAQNTEALKRFAALSIPMQQQVIENAHTITTSDEMRAYVNAIGTRGE